jgi:ankyrin repeat protein
MKRLSQFTILIFLPLFFLGCASQMNIVGVAKKGDLPTAQKLLAKGADVNTKDDHGRTALQYAAAGGYTEIVELLLNNGADVNVPTNFPIIDGTYGTALNFAAAGGHTRIAELLLNKLGDVARKDQYINSALYYATINGHIDIVKILLSNGAYVNNQEENGGTPLYYAAYYGHPELVRFLLSQGANVKARDFEGITSCMFASLFDYSEIVDLLISHGADPHEKITAATLTKFSDARIYSFITSAAVEIDYKNGRWLNVMNARKYYDALKKFDDRRLEPLLGNLNSDLLLEHKLYLLIKLGVPNTEGKIIAMYNQAVHAPSGFRYREELLSAMFHSGNPVLSQAVNRDDFHLRDPMETSNNMVHIAWGKF